MDGRMQEWIAALERLERSDAGSPDVNAVTALFRDDARLASPTVDVRGADAIGRFWRDYRAAFRTISTRYLVRLEHAGRVALEWTSEGELASGEPFRYHGATFFQTADGGISSFRTYFDQRALTAHADVGDEAAAAAR